jgi:8-amino-7-oxononanoate synthase
MIRYLHNQLQLLSQILSKTVTQPPPNHLRPQPLIIPSQEPQSPIFSIMSASPRNLAKWCQEGGFIVRAIVPPTVPRGTERVRVCLHAGNTVEEIDALVKRIGEWVIAQGPKDGRDAKL